MVRGGRWQGSSNDIQILGTVRTGDRLIRCSAMNNATVKNISANSSHSDLKNIKLCMLLFRLE